MLKMIGYTPSFRAGWQSVIQQVWPVFAMVLLLSHGQATIERSFSINKELVVKNQQEQSQLQGGLMGYQGPHVACEGCHSTRSKYTHYLTQKKEQEEKRKQDKKRKAETEAIQ